MKLTALRDTVTHASNFRYTALLTSGSAHCLEVFVPSRVSICVNFIPANLFIFSPLIYNSIVIFNADFNIYYFDAKLSLICKMLKLLPNGLNISLKLLPTNYFQFLFLYILL